MDDQTIAAVLDRYTPDASDVPNDWADVLDRSTRPATPASPVAAAALDGAGTQPCSRAPHPRGRVRRAVALALVAAAVAIVAATTVSPGLAHRLGDFSSWLTGLPGKDAPRADQRAFDRATRKWGDFPKGTQLHRLLQTTTDGVTVALDGYRVGDSLCLRVVARGEATGSAESCAPLQALETQKFPALVALADRGFGIIVGKPVRIGPDVYTHSPRVDVTVGFVADGVDHVEVEGGGRSALTRVGTGAFLAVVDRPAVDFRIRHVWASSDGARAEVPLAQVPFGSFDSESGRARKALGPSKVQRVVTDGRIGWLDRREPRGHAVPSSGIFAVAKKDRFVRHVLFERVVAPDLRSPVRVIVIRATIESFGISKPVEGICMLTVSTGSAGGGCSPTRALFAHRPFSAGEGQDGGNQYETISGLASDAVDRMELFLADGERIAVPLADNVFVVQAAIAASPARLVAYDRKGLIIGVQTLPDGRASSGPVSPTATWKTVGRATSPSGEKARIMIAPKHGGGLCWAFRYGNGGGGDGCFAEPWRGPALNVSYSAHGARDPSPAFVEGEVRPGIAVVELDLRGGKRLRLRVVHDLVLGALPRGYRVTGNAVARGLDAHGRQVAREEVRL